MGMGSTTCSQKHHLQPLQKQFKYSSTIQWTNWHMILMSAEVEVSPLLNSRSIAVVLDPFLVHSRELISAITLDVQNNCDYWGGVSRIVLKQRK